MIGMLKDENLMVRLNTANAIGRLGPAAHSAVPSLIAAYYDPEVFAPFDKADLGERTYLREAVVMAIELVRGKEFSIKDSDVYPKGDKITLPRICEGLKSNNKADRQNAIAFLLDEWRSTLPSIYFLKGKTPGDQLTAQARIGQIGEATYEAMHLLAKELISTHDKQTRLDTIRQLGRFGLSAMEVIPALDEMADFNDPEISSEAILALEAITGEDFEGLSSRARQNVLSGYFVRPLPYDYRVYTQELKAADKEFIRNKFSELRQLIAELSRPNLPPGKSLDIGGTLVGMKSDFGAQMLLEQDLMKDLAKDLDQDKPWKVREETWEFLAEIGWEPQDEKERILFYLLDSKREEGKRKLGEVGWPAVEYIIRDVESERTDRFYRRYILSALGYVQDDRVIPILMQYAMNPATPYMALATLALLKQGQRSRPQIPTLVAEYQQRMNNFRGGNITFFANIAKLVGLYGDESNVPFVIQATGNRWYQVRVGALEGLEPWISRNRDAYRTVYSALGDKDNHVAEAAIRVFLSQASVPAEVQKKTAEYLENVFTGKRYSYPFIDLIGSFRGSRVDRTLFEPIFLRWMDQTKREFQLAGAVGAVYLSVEDPRILDILIKDVNYYGERGVEARKALVELGQRDLKVVPALEEILKRRCLMYDNRKEIEETLKRAKGVKL